MNIEEKQKVTDMLMIQAEMKEQSLSDNLLQYLVQKLEPFGFEPVMQALERIGFEHRFKISLADIISRIDDGRPTAQIAWTQCPKSESESKVLTTEQNQAFCEVSKQYNSGDKVGAKLAFIERYNDLVNEAKANTKPVEYFFARGFDKQGRKDAVYEAVQSGKLLKQKACHLLGYEFDNEVMALESPKEPPIMIEHTNILTESIVPDLSMNRLM